MSSYAQKDPPKTSLRFFKNTLLYILLIPFINWSFTWAPMVELPGLAAWAFNPVTIVTGLVLVVRDFSQREIGHEVLIAMGLALFLTFVTSGGASPRKRRSISHFRTRGLRSIHLYKI